MKKAFIVSQIFLIMFTQINCSYKNHKVPYRKQQLDTTMKQNSKKFAQAVLNQYAKDYEPNKDYLQDQLQTYKKTNKKITILLFKNPKKGIFFGYMCIKAISDEYDKLFSFPEAEIEKLQLKTFCKIMIEETKKGYTKK